MTNPREQYGLGRKEAKDTRDQDYPMKRLAVARATPQRHYRYHYANGWWGNQGDEPQCVAYAWLHWLEDGPVTQPLTPHKHPNAVLPPDPFYREAQKNDEWPGTDYDGTSVRAGAKIGQKHGFISEYYWAFDGVTAMRAVLNGMPLVMGTWWRDGMWETDQYGFVEYRGSYDGGHAWVVNGGWIPRGMTIEAAIRDKVGYIRGKNSWGRSWGKKGHFYMSLYHFDQAIREQGEACVATEVRKAA